MMNAEFLRKRFKEINDFYAKEGLFAQPSKLRVEVPLQDGVGRYAFNIKKDQPSNAREVTLNRNDLFIPNFIGLFLAVQNTTSPGAAPLRTYPPIAPGGSTPSGFEAGFLNANIEALYNGRLSWQIGQTVLFESFPTEAFRYVPQQQPGFLLQNDNTAVEIGDQAEFQFPNFMVPMAPKVTIAGTQDHRIEVNFDASGLTFDCTENYSGVLVLEMDGYLVKNGCEFFEGNPNQKAIGIWN